MTNISIEIFGAHAHKTGQEGILTTGMVGATVTFTFGNEWDGLTKMAVFRGGGVTKTKPLTDAVTTIPVEVLPCEGYLEIGAEGYSPDGDIVIPTVWVTAGRIHAGANATGDPAADPEAPNWTRAVLYAPQKLTEEQQAQARKNIGADAPQTAGAGEYVFTVTGTPDAGYTADKPYEEVLAAYEGGRTVICVLNGGMAANFRLPLIMASDGVLAFALSPIPGTIFMVSLTPSGCMVSESISTMTIGDQEWDFDGPVDFTDTINGMIDEKIGAGQGGGKWEIISEHTIDSVVSAEIPCNFNDYKKVAIIFNGFGTTPNEGKINAHFMYADTDTTKQMVQTIGTTNDKRFGYIVVDTELGEIRYPAALSWAHASKNLFTIPDAPAQRYFEGAIGVRLLCIDSAGGGTTPSTTNTMGGNVIVMGYVGSDAVAPITVSGDYELIADITLGEAVGSFSITTDTDGKPFLLKKYLLAYVWNTPAEDATLPSYLYLSENNGTWGVNQPALYTSAFQPPVAGKMLGGFFEVELLPNKFVNAMAFANTGDNLLEPFYPGIGNVNSLKAVRLAQRDNFAKFYEIGGRCNDGTVPAGSRIMLWGVRA